MVDATYYAMHIPINIHIDFDNNFFEGLFYIAAIFKLSKKKLKDSV